jgi:hypothetical protein
MSRIPTEQCSPYGPGAGHSQQQKAASAQAPTHRHQDRGGGEDKADGAKLPVYCRYHDLVENGICSSWQQLNILIAKHGFPYGIMLSPNVRAWDVEEIRQWLASRPRDRKILPKGARRPRRTAAITPETELAAT